MSRTFLRRFAPALVAAAAFAPRPGCADSKTDFPYGQVWAVTKSALTGSDTDGVDVKALALDTSGNLVIGGDLCPNNSGCGADGFVARISAGGSVLMRAVKLTDMTVNGMTLDGANNIYLCGYNNGNGTNHAIKTLKLDANGNQLGYFIGNSPGQPSDTLVGIAALGGNSYVVGSEGGNNYFAGLNTTMSSTLFVRTDVQADGIATDGTYIYVIGNNAVDGWLVPNITGDTQFSRSPTYSAVGNCQYNGANILRFAANGEMHVAKGFAPDRNNVGGCYIGLNEGDGIHLTDASFLGTDMQHRNVNDFSFLPTGQMIVVWEASSGGGGLTAATRGTDSTCCPSTNAPAFIGNWDQTSIAGMTPRLLQVGSNGYVYVAGTNNGQVPNDRQYVVAAFANPGSKLPAKGAVEVRNNVIRYGSSAATIIVNGTAGATVNIMIFSMAGVALGKPKGGGITIGADGAGMMRFDGNLEGGIALPAGMYWVVTNGDIRDRKPLIIAAPAKE